MKPKNELQKRIVDLSKEVKPATKKQVEYAFSKVLDSNGLRKKNSMLCLECGFSWKSNEVCKVVDCPECKKRLIVSDNIPNESAYYGVLDVHSGYQIVRLFWVRKKYYKNIKAIELFEEVIQHWIDKSGHVTTLQKQVNGMSRYYDQWVFDSELQVRNMASYQSTLRYGIAPFKIYPKRKLLPELKRNGFSGFMYDFAPHKLFSLLLRENKAETLIKSKQISLLKYIDVSREKIERFWPSIKICIRNGYIVENASDYFDYLKLLEFFCKDLRSPFYVCPENFDNAHDRYVKKKKVYDRKLKLQKQREKIEADQKEYEESKGRFFGLEFTDDLLSVKVIESVYDFEEEGDELGHCVYASEYHKKEDSLLFSAMVSGKRTETVEVSLKEMKVTQARGKGNKASRYHKKIVNLVNRNLNRVQTLISETA